HRGSNFPYHLKTKSKRDGTYIRVGSSNHLADETIIADLERQKRNVSYDSEPILDYGNDELDISSFRSFYEERTGEALDEIALRKLELVKLHQGNLVHTHAFVLFSEGAIRRKYFPYAKIECARFKGTDTG